MTDQNFYEDLFDDVKETPEGRLVKNMFSPWHHPRKHLVRLEQWVYFIDKMFEKTLCDRKHLKYFSLPGDDLLDIRTIHDEICINRGIKLQFMGFNDHEDDDLREQNANISLAEVRALPNIDPISEYHHNNILTIANKGSLAYDRFKEFADYDVINLDFCDSITQKKPADGNPNHYNLLTKIIQLQNHRDKPWMLFLTTRIGVNHVHEQALESFRMHYKLNLNHDAFKEKSHETFDVFDEETLNLAFSDCDIFRKVISTSLCKWLLSFSLSLTPKTTIKILDAMEYKVLPESEFPDMISIALMFTPHPDSVIDPLGLAKPKSKIHMFDEPTIASGYLEKINKCTNCDEYLATSPDKKEFMIDKTISLLDSARFDTSEYRVKFG